MIDLGVHFGRIKAFYGPRAAALALSRDDWGMDPYEWEEAGIVLSPIEAALWHDIRAESLVLYPQYPVGRFFVDFGNPAWRVAIECDGARWHTDRERDQQRQAQIEALGWTVHRVGGSTCKTDTAVTETESGGLVATVSDARQFVRGVAAVHPGLVRRSARPGATN